MLAGWVIHCGDEALAVPVSDYAGRVSVVIPAHNEADNLASLIAEVVAALTGYAEFEILVVDDGSTDATSLILKQAVARHAELRCLRHRVSCGQSQAVSTGVRAARFEWIATLDGDGQNDPADIPRLLDSLADPALPANLVLINGWRTQRDDGWLKRVSSRVANTVRATLLHDATPDSGCGIKVFSREHYLALPNFDHMHRFLPALFKRQGGAMVSIAVRHRPRRRGCSHYGVLNRLGVGLIDVCGVAWLQRRARLPDVLHDDPADGR